MCFKTRFCNLMWAKLGWNYCENCVSPDFFFIFFLQLCLSIRSEVCGVSFAVALQHGPCGENAVIGASDKKWGFQNHLKKGRDKKKVILFSISTLAETWGQGDIQEYFYKQIHPL